jgi:hypothetical protein
VRVVELRLRKEPAGFQEQCGCVDLINNLRIILNQSNEWQSTLYLTFIDFEKAVVSLNRQVIWEVLEKCGIPAKILKLIKDMCEDFKCQVLHDGKLTEYIKVTTGVRQAYILSPTIFCSCWKM